jgi:hypothetical protein
MNKFNITNITKLIKEIKNYVGRGESLDITVGYNPESKEWSYQTGDNSFSGSAYFYPVWGVTTIYPRSKSKDLAKDVINQILDQSEYYQAYHKIA